MTGVSRDGLLVRFRGTAARVERAFHTRLERYRLANGTAGHITTAAPMLPRTIARSVAAVVGLDNLVRLHPLDIVHPPRSTWGTRRKAVAGSFPHPPAPRRVFGASKAANRNGGLTDDKWRRVRRFRALQGGRLRRGDSTSRCTSSSRSRARHQDSNLLLRGHPAARCSPVHVVGVEAGSPQEAEAGRRSSTSRTSGMAPGASIDVYEGPSPSANGVEYDPVDPYVKCRQRSRPDDQHELGAV